MRSGHPILLSATALFALVGCEGNGSAGGGLEIENAVIAPNCTSAGNGFPSGLGVLSASAGLAALVQTDPPGVLVYNLDSERPVLRSFANIGEDSDSDGRNDGEALLDVLNLQFPVPASALRPVMGEIQILRDDLGLVSTSTYEQILIYDPSIPTPRIVVMETPSLVPLDRYPLWPPPGQSEIRTGLSTLACVVPPIALDSKGDAIGMGCDDDLPSYFTSLTSGKAVAAERLFVATSNLAPTGGDRFHPGTVLVFNWIEAGGTIVVRPDPETPILFTTGFNPTGVRRVVTPGGRELVLVTITGVIGTQSGAANILTEAAIDVIDPTIPRIVARIPLGLAGPSFEGLAIEPGGRVGWLGASSQLQLYAIDLRALDNANLYAEVGPPEILDGLSVGFEDARIFTGDTPLVLPDRPGGPREMDCDGFTHVAVNVSGTEVYSTDFCDGTLTRIRLDLPAGAPIPYKADNFQLVGQLTPFSPNNSLGELRSPSILAVRPGVPGIDFTTPDVLVLVGQPDAQLCSLRIESFE